MGEDKKKKTQLPFRLNILFLIVFLLFSGLILQLGVLQILKGEEAQNEINRTEDTPTKVPVPRGKMYDRFGRIILDNEPVRAITYTPPKRGASAEERLKLAEKLAEFIDVENAKDLVKERDKKEYWYLVNQKQAEAKLSQEEAADMKVSEQYQTMLDRITEEELGTIEWSSLYEVIAIKKELDSASELSPHIVKNEGVTEEEYAKVAEHLNELPGIDAIIDWNRKSAANGALKDIIGSITDADRGLPSENLSYYLTRGYNRNDRVGISGLEQKYEEVLRGQKEEILYTTNSAGNVINTEIITEGKRGSDLVLSVDLELQQAMDAIVRDELKKTIEQNPSANKYLEDAMAIVLNPNTGEILGMSGQRYDRDNNKYVDNAFRVMYDQHLPGSVVKGATLLSGYDSGVVSPGDVLLDEPIKIGSGSEKSSWRDMGMIDDYTALERSSNVYMFRIAMRMGGEYNYQYGEPIDFNSEAFQTMRNYFNQFGLGVKTGIDFPYESTGYQGGSEIGGLLLDYAIGQYDSFTTLQLAQYISTIANGGYRIRPRLVTEIRDPVSEKGELGAVDQSFNTDVLNKIEMEDSYLDRVKEGFRRVFHGNQGTANTGVWSGADYKVAGKTGTAENLFFENGEQVRTENHTLVGYAPYDNPEVAFAIVVPKMGLADSIRPAHHNIGRRIMDKYFELKEERANNGIDEDLSSNEEEEESGDSSDDSNEE